MAEWFGAILVGGLLWLMAKNKPIDMQIESVPQTHYKYQALNQPVRTESSYNHEEKPINEKASPTGIGGWLSLLIFGMMIIGPLTHIGSIGSNLSMNEQSEPLLKTLEDWQIYKVSIWAVELSVLRCSVLWGDLIYGADEIGRLLNRLNYFYGFPVP